MPYYKDLREHLAALETAGKLRRIKRPVNKDTELHPLAKLPFRGLPEDQRQALFFENVIGSQGCRYGSPVVVGALAASREIYAIGLQCRPDEISSRLIAGEKNPIPPRIVSSGLVQEEIHLGNNLLEHGGMAEFPIPVATPGFDPAPYITAPCWITKDPDTGIPNVGMYRAMLKSPDRTGVNFATLTRGGYIHYRKCKECGKALEAALVIGGPPSLAYTAVSPLPVDVSELAVAGGIGGEPLDLVNCQMVDIEVPANAEIVLEGEISTAEVEPEAPFGEAYGFVGLADLNPFFTVKCISHRKRPIWLATVSQYPPSESTQIRKHANEAALMRHLRHVLGLDYVRAVSFAEAGGSLRIIAIQCEDVGAERVWPALEAAAKRIPASKILIAVNADVNIEDLDGLSLALVMRTQAHRDFRIQTGPAPSLGDYSLESLDKLENRSPTDPDRPQSSRLLINAVMRWPYPPTSLPTRPFIDRALEMWQQEGLPPLKLREPWWGTSLGFWTAAEEERAVRAANGEQFAAGTEYRKGRRPA
jgi:4-hydroxy-3-polyprenylbenzoate decarboxylase